MTEPVASKRPSSAERGAGMIGLVLALRVIRFSLI
jgi:hypothetical protein